MHNKRNLCWSHQNIPEVQQLTPHARLSNGSCSHSITQWSNRDLIPLIIFLPTFKTKDVSFCTMDYTLCYPGADPGMGQTGPGLPLLTAKSCKFSLFWVYIRQFLPSFDTRPPPFCKSWVRPWCYQRQNLFKRFLILEIVPEMVCQPLGGSQEYCKHAWPRKQIIRVVFWIGRGIRGSHLRFIHTTPQLCCVAILHPPAQKLRCYCVAVSHESWTDFNLKCSDAAVTCRGK